MTQTIDELNAAICALSCGDNSCVIAKPVGPGLNGGCSCFRDLPLEDRRLAHAAITLLRRKVTYLERIITGDCK